VSFEDVDGDQCRVTLFLGYEPEGLVEKAGDALKVVECQAESDLEKFKTFIESEGYASGAWRGTVEGESHGGTPGVEHAAASEGDSGKAGMSGKAVATGVCVAAAAATAAVVVSKTGSDDKDAGGVEVATPVTGRVSNLTTTPATGTPGVTPPERFSTADVGGPAAATGSCPNFGSDMGADSSADSDDDMPLLADEDDPLGDTGSEKPRPARTARAAPHSRT
jgi:hypothetical protein